MNKKFNGTTVETDGVRTIEGGGTGATTAEQARINLGITGGGGVTSYNDLTDLPTLGTAAATAATDYAPADDPRLTDSRSPVGHKSSHATGGTDALTPADIGAEPSIATLPISKGGTGAATAAAALTALGAVAKAGDTMTGKLILPASTTASAPINIPHGTDAASPVNGDLWLNGTLRYRDQAGITRFVADLNRPNSFTQRQTITADSFTTSPALRITQEGTGEAFRVEDGPTPDATAFVISNSGRVGIGVAPDAAVCLSVDSSGIKFNDGTVQTTAPAAAQVNADWNSTGGVSQVLNKPTLGTAAATNATDYATAAQGAKADSALQSAATVVAGVFYVAKNGSNSNAGSAVAPFLTIQHAINQVPAGTDDYTIYVASGIYDENLTINRINIHIVGMTDDALQNKAIVIRGTTSITATGTGSLFNNTIVLNNLTLSNTSTAGYVVSSTGSGYSLTIKNIVIEQDNAGFGAVNIANATNDTRTYFDNCFVSANPANRNAIDFSAGTIFEIRDSIFYANGSGGLALNVTSSNAWITSAKKSTFQALGKAIVLSTNNHSTSNLSSFENCTITGIPASSTTGIISLGGGTQAAFSFTRCNLNNLATNAASDFPYFEFNTAAILFSVGNIFSCVKTSAVNFRPVYAVTTAAPNAVVKIGGNVFVSNKTSGTDTVVIPTAGVAGWAIVESLLIR
jgi:hypothetical protein